MFIKNLIKKTTGLTYLNTLGKVQLRNHAVILMLHRVIKNKNQARLPHNNPLCIDTETFNKLIIFLKKHFEIVDLESAINSNHSLKPKLTLTFDDGWKDNILHAYPILKKHNIPASVFLSTDYIGENKGFWWESIAKKLWQSPLSVNKEHLLKSLNKYSISVNQNIFNTEKTNSKSLLILEFIQSLKDIEPQELNTLAERFFFDNTPDALDWSDVRLMEDSGLIKFGPHGAQHYILTGLDQSACEHDIMRSHAALNEHCARPLKIYCYPNGNNNSVIQSLLSNLGYTHALSTQSGLISTKQNEYCLPRIDVSQKSAEQPGLLAWRIFQGSRKSTHTTQPQSLRSFI